MKQNFKMKYRKTISLIAATLVSLMLVGGTYKSWCNKNINLSFKSTNIGNITYKLYYTTNAKEDFNSKKVVTASLKDGVHKVKMVIPTQNVAKIRLNISNRPGTINIAQLKLNGHASIDLSDFSSHEYRNIDEEEILPDGSMMLISEQENPYILIKSVFNLHEGYDIDFFKVLMFFGSIFLIVYIFFMFALFEKKKKKKDLMDYY